MLDGNKVKIGWRKTTSWWRDWNVARWRWDFAIAGHAATLHCEVSQPPSARARLRGVLGGTPKAAARGVAASTLTGVPAIGGGIAAGTMADRLEKMRRWNYVLEIDGHPKPGRPIRT